MQYKITTNLSCAKAAPVATQPSSITKNIMKTPKKNNLLKGVLIFVLILLTSGVIIISNELKIPYKIYSVESGSMSPTLRTGDLIITKETPTYQTGDIVTFRPNTATQKYQSVTHRIIDTKEINGTSVYTTKGDFNNAPDLDPLYKNQIIGKFVARIPLLGYFTSFLRTMFGFILIIVIPTTLLIYQEIINIITVLQKKNEQTS